MSKATAQIGFKIGEMAVYPAHGVGVIQAIETKEIFGTNHIFYVLKVLGSDATIMVPVKNASTVGLRKIVRKNMVPKVYKILQGKKEPILDTQTWNRRYREYTEKIRTGCVMELAEVLRDLYLLKVDKELSFGERKMLDTAKELLVKELSVVKKIKEDKLEKEIDRLMLNGK